MRLKPRMGVDPPVKVCGAVSASKKHQRSHFQSGLETPQPPDDDSVFNETEADVAEEQLEDEKSTQREGTSEDFYSRTTTQQDELCNLSIRNNIH